MTSALSAWFLNREQLEGKEASARLQEQRGLLASFLPLFIFSSPRPLAYTSLYLFDLHQYDTSMDSAPQSATGAASLSTLTPELLRRIVQYSLPNVYEHTFAERYDMLLSLSLVDKTLGAIAQQELDRMFGSLATEQWRTLSLARSPGPSQRWLPNR